MLGGFIFQLRSCLHSNRGLFLSILIKLIRYSPDAGLNTMTNQDQGNLPEILGKLVKKITFLDRNNLNMKETLQIYMFYKKINIL